MEKKSIYEFDELEILKYCHIDEKSAVKYLENGAHVYSPEERD